MTGKLYIVATPIGNLGDITLRAIEILKKVEFIACEDTRRTNNLLKSIQANQGQFLISFYEQNELSRMENILNILRNGKDVALVSDSGTPMISDPGFKFVREAIRQGIPVVSIPGPSSVVSALVSSGLPTDKFLFLGFLPKKEGHRRTLLENVRKSNEIVNASIILFESPFRVHKTLAEIYEVFGDINASVCRELTKVYEEVRRGKLSELIKYFNKDNKGEFVIVLSTKD